MRTVQSIRRTRTELGVKEFVSRKNVGFNKNNIEAFELIPDTFADRDLVPGETYYYYIGPDDDKTRAFCKYLLKLDKVFSMDDINFMSERLGYDVKFYKGAYNCRHKWVRFRGKFIIGNPPTNRQINTLIEKNILY